VTILALGLFGISSAQESPAFSLPYDSTCPVIYDNDDHDDMYTDEYLLSLASAGNITLKGMITTSGGWSEPSFPDPVFVFQWDLTGRSELVGKARRSGMSNLPTPIPGSGVALVKPGSGVIEDTVPIDTPGARWIVTEARNATNKPLVVVMGGPPTTLASAYLMDNSITNTVVLAWLSGGPGENDLQDFNNTVDRWATSIVVRRFRAVLFALVFNQSSLVNKSQLTQLPNTELRQWMIDKNLPHANLPNGQDHDGPPAITLMRSDYVVAGKPKSYAGTDGGGNAFLHDDANGNILMVTQADQTIATTEWWRALSNSAAYGNSPFAPAKVPFRGAAAPIPGTIEAENFDYGGPGVSYSNLIVKTEDEYINRYVTTFRVTDSVDFDLASGDAGGYAVAVTQPGEWIAYTVNVVATAPYTVDVRVASKGSGGSFHLEFNGAPVPGTFNIPNTGDWQNWQTLTKSNVTLTAGQQVMRIVMDSGGVSNLVGDINYVRIWPAGRSGPNDDPDGDGLTNTQEDTLGTDPLDGTISSALQVARRLDNTVQLGFSSVGRRVYTIEYRDGFGGGTSWQPISNFQNVVGNGGVLTCIDDGSGTGSSPAVAPARLYRLHVNLPP
jgi:hypothetical protein